MPEQKQHELQRVIEILREEMDLDMLILFGSYARGDWGEDHDPKTLLYRYQSDFDLLVITETPCQANKIEQNHELAQKTTKTLCKKKYAKRRLKASANKRNVPHLSMTRR